MARAWCRRRARVRLVLHYAANRAAPPPNQLVLKRALSEDAVLAQLYSNEARFYRRLRPELDIETPRCFGSAWGESTAHFALLLEDLAQRAVCFPNVLSILHQ